LRHLRIVGEPLVLRLVSLHNLHLYGELTRLARQAIIDGRYQAFRDDYLQQLQVGDVPLAEGPATELAEELA
jgi:tRNA-guanine family transglycosylase